MAPHHGTPPSHQGWSLQDRQQLAGIRGLMLVPHTTTSSHTCKLVGSHMQMIKRVGRHTGITQPSCADTHCGARVLYSVKLKADVGACVHEIQCVHTLHIHTHTTHTRAHTHTQKFCVCSLYVHFVTVCAHLSPHHPPHAPFQLPPCNRYWN